MSDANSKKYTPEYLEWVRSQGGFFRHRMRVVGNKAVAVFLNLTIMSMFTAWAMFSLMTVWQVVKWVW